MNTEINPSASNNTNYSLTENQEITNKSSSTEPAVIGFLDSSQNEKIHNEDLKEELMARKLSEELSSTKKTETTVEENHKMLRDAISSSVQKRKEHLIELCQFEGGKSISELILGFEEDLEKLLNSQKDENSLTKEKPSLSYENKSSSSYKTDSSETFEESLSSSPETNFPGFSELQKLAQGLDYFGATSSDSTDTNDLIQENETQTDHSTSIQNEPILILLEEKKNLMLHTNEDSIETIHPESEKQVLSSPTQTISRAELKDIEQASKEIPQLTAILKKYAGLGIHKDMFKTVLSPGIPFFVIEIERQIILNKCMNTQLFVCKAKQFAENNKMKIASGLIGIPDDFNGTIKIKSVSVIDNTAETHNQGKKPITITFTVDNDEFKCVYKPRTAYIDRLAIETFDNLNKLEKDNSCHFHIYKILQPEQQQKWIFLESEEKMSIWEFVEGDTVRDLSSKEKIGGCLNVNEYVSDTSEREQIFRKGLNKMAVTFHEMKISDQHTENIMVTYLTVDSQKVYRLVGIDFETMDRGGSGLRVELSSCTPLQKEEKQCIHDSFSSKLKDVPVTRVVPINTGKLLGMITNFAENFEKNPETIDKNILEIFSGLGSDFVLKTDLNLYFLCKHNFIYDAINGDTPYFTQSSGKLYYGFPERKVEIGSKKEGALAYPISNEALFEYFNICSENVELIDAYIDIIMNILNEIYQTPSSTLKSDLKEAFALDIAKSTPPCFKEYNKVLYYETKNNRLRIGKLHNLKSFNLLTQEELNKQIRLYKKSFKEISTFKALVESKLQKDNYEKDEDGLKLMQNAFYQDVLCGNNPGFADSENALYYESPSVRIKIAEKKTSL